MVGFQTGPAVWRPCSLTRSREAPVDAPQKQNAPRRRSPGLGRGDGAGPAGLQRPDPAVVRGLVGHDRAPHAGPVRRGVRRPLDAAPRPVGVPAARRGRGLRPVRPLRPRRPAGRDALRHLPGLPVGDPRDAALRRRRVRGLRPPPRRVVRPGAQRVPVPASAHRPGRAVPAGPRRLPGLRALRPQQPGGPRLSPRHVCGPLRCDRVPAAVRRRVRVLVPPGREPGADRPGEQPRVRPPSGSRRSTEHPPSPDRVGDPHHHAPSRRPCRRVDRGAAGQRADRGEPRLLPGPGRPVAHGRRRRRAVHGVRLQRGRPAGGRPGR